MSRCSKLRGQNCGLVDHLVGAGEQERWHIETIALAALSLFMPFPQSIMLTPFWAPPASAAHPNTSSVHIRTSAALRAASHHRPARLHGLFDLLLDGF